MVQLGPNFADLIRGGSETETQGASARVRGVPGCFLVILGRPHSLSLSLNHAPLPGIRPPHPEAPLSCWHEFRLHHLLTLGLLCSQGESGTASHKFGVLQKTRQVLATLLAGFRHQPTSSSVRIVPTYMVIPCLPSYGQVSPKAG